MKLYIIIKKYKNWKSRGKIIFKGKFLFTKYIEKFVNYSNIQPLNILAIKIFK